MQAVLPRLAGGSIPAELVAAAADASIFALVCLLCGGCMGGLGGEPPRSPAVACFGTWVVGHLKRVLRLSLHVFARVCVSLSVIFCDVACTMGCGGFAVVFSVGLPSGDPLGVSQGPNWPQQRLKRTRNCTKTKTIYGENSL